MIKKWGPRKKLNYPLTLFLAEVVTYAHFLPSGRKESACKKKMLSDVSPPSAFFTARVVITYLDEVMCLSANAEIKA